MKEERREEKGVMKGKRPLIEGSSGGKRKNRLLDESRRDKEKMCIEISSGSSLSYNSYHQSDSDNGSVDSSKKNKEDAGHFKFKVGQVVGDYRVIKRNKFNFL